MNCQICGSHFAEDQIREGPNSGKIVCGQCASMLRREYQQQLDYQRAVLRSSHNKEFHNNVRACLIYLNADPHAGDRKWPEVVAAAIAGAEEIEKQLVGKGRI